MELFLGGSVTEEAFNNVPNSLGPPGASPGMRQSPKLERQRHVIGTLPEAEQVPWTLNLSCDSCPYP